MKKFLKSVRFFATLIHIGAWIFSIFFVFEDAYQTTYHSTAATAVEHGADITWIFFKLFIAGAIIGITYGIKHLIDKLID